MTARDDERQIGGVRYVTAAGVLALVKVSRNTLYRWRKDGHIPAGARFRDRELVFTDEEVQCIRAFAERVVPARPAGVGENEAEP
jgi:predicted site-specific integrase-resolvase